MAGLSIRTTTFSIIFFVVGLFQILLCGGIVYGSAAIINVFKREGFYYYLCNAKDGILAEGNRSLSHGSLVPNVTLAVFKECASQRERFSLVLTVSLFSVTVFIIPMGIFLDKYGPRATMIIGCFVYALAGVGLTQVTRGTENLLFPVFLLIAFGGQMHVLPILKASSIIFGRLKSLVISIMNGAFDSSAVVLVIFKILYDSGIHLQHISIFYASLSFLTAILVAIFLIPSNKALENLTREKLDPTLILHSDVGSRLANHDAAYLDNDAQSKTFKDIRLTVFVDGDIEDDTKALKSDELDNDTSGQFNESDQETSVSDANHFPASIKSSVLSTIYILQFIFLMIGQLRIWFYIGSLNNYLKVVLKDDRNLVGKYLVVFGYIQLGGLIVATFTGMIFDRNLIFRDNEKTIHSSRRHRLRSSVLAFALTAFFGCVLSILTIINTEMALIPGFVLLVLFRGFLYAGNAAFIGMAFKTKFFGTLFGIIMFTASVFGVSQFPMFVIMEEYLKGDPYWMNVGLLILSIVVGIHPLYLWHYTKVPTGARAKRNT